MPPSRRSSMLLACTRRLPDVAQPAAADLAADPGARRYRARDLGSPGLLRARRAFRQPGARAAHRCVQPHADARSRRSTRKLNGAARQPASAAAHHARDRRAAGSAEHASAWCCKASRTACRSTSAACACTKPAQESLTVATIGPASQALARRWSLRSRAGCRSTPNGLSTLHRGQLVYEPDVRRLAVPVPAALCARRPAFAGDRAADRREPRVRRADRRAPRRRSASRARTASSCAS